MISFEFELFYVTFDILITLEDTNAIPKIMLK